MTNVRPSKNAGETSRTCRAARAAARARARSRGRNTRARVARARRGARLSFSPGGPWRNEEERHEARGAQTYVVGVDKDEWFTTFGNGAVAGSDKLITSGSSVWTRRVCGDRPLLLEHGWRHELRPLSVGGAGAGAASRLAAPHAAAASAAGDHCDGDGAYNYMAADVFSTRVGPTQAASNSLGVRPVRHDAQPRVNKATCLIDAGSTWPWALKFLRAAAQSGRTR